MYSILAQINQYFTDDNDFFKIDHKFNHENITFIGINSLINLPRTLDSIKEQLRNAEGVKTDIHSVLKYIGETKTEIEDIQTAILQGKLIICLENEANYAIVVNPIEQKLNRSIEAPVDESVLQGPLNAFNEDSNINIGLIRKEIVSEKLKTIHFSIGKDNKRSISLLYYNNGANGELIKKVIQHIEQNSDKELYNIQDMIKMLGLSSRNVMSQINTTAVPQEASIALLKGRIILFMDRTPYALVIPSVIWDMFSLESDRNFTFPLMVSLRTLRFIGFLITLILPGLYVALVSVNPEVLRIELALSVAQSREGVPYPALIEIMFMLLILELILEASVRLPKSIGPTITMVGGIILGQAVVQAMLVSNLLIIILAAVTIANSTIVGIQNSIAIRLFKYLILILASIFGVMGILVGVFLVSSYLASINTFGVPYLNFNTSKGDIKSG
ncbi:spore germination protein [Radiobacillus sp. PE A8.2]|uniref:spore germination protein n=1 Tax=Radiobacillus sp. PE A8.2 TaxID=3380349 RepID=UPI00388F47BD